MTDKQVKYVSTLAPHLFVNNKARANIHILTQAIPLTTVTFKLDKDGKLILDTVLNEK